MPANEMQIGGRHYKTEYEHWDLAIVIPLGYLEGCTTKYVARWRKKGGILDLEKALHYLDKLIETTKCQWSPRTLRAIEITREVTSFVKANDLTDTEGEYIHYLCAYRSVTELKVARNILITMIEDATENLQARPEPKYPGTPEDGGHHEQGPA